MKISAPQNGAASFSHGDKVLLSSRKDRRRGPDSIHFLQERSRTLKICGGQNNLLVDIGESLEILQVIMDTNI